MDSKLNIELSITTEGKLFVVDNSDYSEWSSENDINHEILERVIKINVASDSGIIGYSDTFANTEEALEKDATFDLSSDGWLKYQKIVIPTKEHAESNANEILYYDNGIVYYNDLDAGIQKHWSNIREDFDEIYNIVVDKQITNCFTASQDTFSIYNLIQCYLKLEHEAIQNYLKNNCFGNCKDNSDLNERADILLAAILTINSLLEEGNFSEAARVLNGLDTCGSLCKEFKNELNDCGCGKA